MSQPRARRALLFIPGDSERKIAKGMALDVDAVILDLEDGVAISRKEEARETVWRLLTSTAYDFGRSERLVRINAARPGDPAALEMQARDVMRTIEGQPDGYVIPKVESPQDIQRIAHMLLAQECVLGYPQGQIKIFAMIETARAIVNLREIAQADDRLVALLFGAEDLAAELGVIRSKASTEVLHARSAIAIHAAAFDLEAIDTPYVDLNDMDGLRLEAEHVKSLGFVGKLAIHPAQIEPIVEVFTPSAEAIDAAYQLLEAYQAHQFSGAGAFAHGGKMVDRPVIRAAERLLARAQEASKPS